MPQMLFVDEKTGEWVEFPALEMAGMAGNRLVMPTKADLIPLPEGATLTMMPGAQPIGIDAESGEFLLLDENPYEEAGRKVCALAALLPQGFTRLLLPVATDSDQNLPLLGYTAVGLDNGQLVVAAQRADEHRRWHPQHYNTPGLKKLVEKRLQLQPDNRILQHLAHCALEYGCFTAQNVFYRRWEGGIPVSPRCNANCIGCISLQPSECCPSPQNRITFIPTPDEVAESAIDHLQHAEDGIISFGQGCEGEPSLQYKVIAEAIAKTRAVTDKGIININTNAGNTEAIRAICDAGIDTLRISLFSPVPEDYAAYHKPAGYTLQDVKNSLIYAHEHGKQTSLNLLAYPGYIDDPRHVDALIDFIRETGVQLLQIRNLNIDPKRMKDICGDSHGMGMRQMIDYMQGRLPELAIGSYTHKLEEDDHGLLAEKPGKAKAKPAPKQDKPKQNAPKQSKPQDKPKNGAPKGGKSGKGGASKPAGGKNSVSSHAKNNGGGLLAGLKEQNRRKK
ncbi:MAG: radical SAM protein [Firmicutes bacterium]|nr:radical SAM protein [Bacillota bacterium]